VSVIQCNPTVCGRGKSEGEAHIITFALNYVLNSHVDHSMNPQRIFKISGRYLLTHNFDYQTHVISDKIVVRRISESTSPQLATTVTSLYSFPLLYVPYILERLKPITYRCQSNIETEIFPVTRLDDTMFHLVPEIGITGIFAPYGTKTNA
jgi:hypothetical protein